MLDIFIVIFLASLVIAWVSLAPWVPTNLKDLERVNKIANLKPGQTFLEMGSGNARVCAYIAKQNPEVRVIGIELAFFFYLFSKIRIALFGPKNVEIVFGNALKYDISGCDVIYTFALIKTLNVHIKEKILQEMKPSAKLISYVFSMREWAGKKTMFKEDGNNAVIYSYEK